MVASILATISEEPTGPLTSRTDLFDRARHKAERRSDGNGYCNLRAHAIEIDRRCELLDRETDYGNPADHLYFYATVLRPQFACCFAPSLALSNDPRPSAAHEGRKDG